MVNCLHNYRRILLLVASGSCHCDILGITVLLCLARLSSSYCYSSRLNCGVAAADTILLQPVLSGISKKILFCPDSSHASVDMVHLSLLRSSSSSSHRWSHFQSISSDGFLVSSLHVSKPPHSRFPAPLCGILHLQSLPDVIMFHIVS